MMIYLELLWSFMKIGLFSFGGGYASVPLIQSQVVDLYHWMDMTEFVDIITISQMTPGPVAINCATFVGIRVGGIPGALVATFGCVLPSCIIVLTLAFIYQKYRNVPVIQGILGGLRPAIVALIASAGVSILQLSIYPRTDEAFRLQNIDWLAIVFFVLCFLILRKAKKLNPIFVMLGAGGVSLVLYLILKAAGIPFPFISA